MGHFDFTRSGGVWTGTPLVTADEMADLDSKTERAINGDEGGTWAPTTVITIGGQGVTITGTSILDDCQSIELTSGFINVYNGAEIRILTGAKLDVQSGGEVEVDSGASVVFAAGSTTTFAGAVGISGTATIGVSSGAVFGFGSGAIVNMGGDMSVTSSGSLAVNSGGAITVASGGVFALSAGASVSIGAAQTISGKVTHSGTGGRTVKRVKSVTNASDTIGVDEADIVYWTTTDGNNYSITLATSPTPDEGETIEIRRRELLAGQGNVIDGATSLAIYRFHLDTATIGSGWMKATWIGSRWRVTGGQSECFTSDS
ncbi:MAG: hypothetical protein HOW73_20640 [Polyangiaceae bacterium]|nr:hypothetical protein [Polyangiaceae bacterium]